MARVIEIILHDDNPQGLRSIGIDNWQGKAFVVPRSNLKIYRARDESRQAGVYILFGGDEQDVTAYIGQTDNLGRRLSDHDKGKKDAEWNFALVFSGNLDSTANKYLESIAVNLAEKAGRYKISNATAPEGGRPNEAQKIGANGYFENMRLISGLFGFPIFENPKKERDHDTYVFEDMRNKDGSGQGTLLQTQEFIVFKGSLARIEEKPGLLAGQRALRSRLVGEGVLKRINDNSYEFTRDYIFTSPSAASNTISGRSTNGWDCWKKDGVTLNDLKLR